MANKQKNEQEELSEIISPIFGLNYKNRVIAKNKKTEINSNDTKIDCVEKQIELAYETKARRDKVQEYQKPFKFDTDVLKNYHKQKEEEEIKANLPSNYLNFHDTFKKTADLSVISDFTNADNNITTVKEETETINNFSEVIDNFFNQD